MTIHELLEDKTYREFFLNPPAMPRVYRQQGKDPWRVYLQLNKRWVKKDLPTYRKAFATFKKYRDDAHDAAIVSRSVAFPPPHRFVRIKGKYQIDSRGNRIQVTKLVVWRPQVPAEELDHRWCPYCRRPTVFSYFSKHHAFTGMDAFGLGQWLRCTICGIRLEGLPRLLRGDR